MGTDSCAYMCAKDLFTHIIVLDVLQFTIHGGNPVLNIHVNVRLDESCL